MPWGREHGLKYLVIPPFCLCAMCVCVRVFLFFPTSVDVTEGQFTHMAIMVVSFLFGPQVWQTVVSIVQDYTVYNKHVL